MSTPVIAIRWLRRGFTLIELLVMIIIITVVAGVLVPAYGRLKARIEFDGVVSDIQDLFAYAREQAIARDAAVTVSYDPQSETFVATVPPSLPTTDIPAVMANEMPTQGTPGEAQRFVQLNADYVVRNFAVGTGNTGSMQGGGGRTLRFRGDGTCDGAQVSLLSRDGYSAEMMLLPANGQLVRTDEVDGRPAQ